MQLERLILNENRTVFKLGENYIIVETNTGNKVRDFQNALIAEELFNRGNVDMHNVNEIIDKFRQTVVLVIE